VNGITFRKSQFVKLETGQRACLELILRFENPSHPMHLKIFAVLQLHELAEEVGNLPHLHYFQPAGMCALPVSALKAKVEVAQVGHRYLCLHDLD
jgi:hypothetical protein